jgi:hypothetical protein
MNNDHKCKVHKDLKDEVMKLVKNLGKRGYCLNEMFIISCMLKSSVERQLQLNDFTENLEKSFKEFGLVHKQDVSAG